MANNTSDDRVFVCWHEHALPVSLSERHWTRLENWTHLLRFGGIALLLNKSTRSLMLSLSLQDRYGIDNETFAAGNAKYLAELLDREMRSADQSDMSALLACDHPTVREAVDILFNPDMETL